MPSDAIAVTDAGASAREELLGKLNRYRHLMPPPPPDAAARMAGGGVATGAAASPGADGVDATPLPTPAWPQPTPLEAADKALGCLLGLAAGSAGPELAAAFCLADTLQTWDGFDEEDFLLRLQALPPQTRDGLDADTRAALDEYAARDTEADPDAVLRPLSTGGAALGRLAPLVLFAAREPDRVELLAARQCRLTHPFLDVVDACRLFASMLLDALSGADAQAATRPRVMELCPDVLLVSAGEWRSKQQDELHPDAGAAGTLEAALWCVSRTRSISDAVALAATFGNAAASVAVLAGQLAGALHGASTIREDGRGTPQLRARLALLADSLRRERPAPEDEP